MGEFVKLSGKEAGQLKELENRIDAAVAIGRDQYFAIGKCLHEIKRSRLYRDQYSSFAEYCQRRWNYSVANGDRLVAAYQTAANLANAEAEQPLYFFNFLENFKPTHARVIGQLPPDQQVEAWSTAKQISDSPTARLLEEVTAKHQEGFNNIDRMTKSEELEYLQRVEADVADAYRQAKRLEFAKLTLKRIRNAIRQLEQPTVGDSFHDAIEILSSAKDFFEKFLAVNDPSTSGTAAA